MKTPTPIHGWRVFAGEVGVIVLGVLLALGAQKVVQDMQTRRDIATFRETIDQEIAYNLWVYDARDRQTGCTETRLGQLSRLLDHAADGSSIALLDTSRPLSFSEYQAAWENRDADTFAELPSDVRRKYAEFYDELANNAANRRMEYDVWTTLIPFEVQAPMTILDRRLLHQALRQAKARNESIHENIRTSAELGKSLGIRPAMPKTMTPTDWASTRRCPTLAQAAG